MLSEDIRARADGGDGITRRDATDGRYGGGNRSIRWVAKSCTTTNVEKRSELDAAFLEEGAEDEHENDDFIVPDDVDSDSERKEQKRCSRPASGRNESCR